MIPIERFYRALLLIERIEQIQGEIAAVAATFPDGDGEARHLDHAELGLNTVLKALREARNLAQSRSPELLEAQLEASLELIGRSPEKLRRLAIVPREKRI